MGVDDRKKRLSRAYAVPFGAFENTAYFGSYVSVLASASIPHSFSR
jgi:hypothetical protein